MFVRVLNICLAVGGLLPPAYKIFKFTDLVVSLFLFVIKVWRKQSLSLKISLINVKI